MSDVSAVGVLLFGSLAASAASDATVLRHSIAKKEFYTRTLAPGARTQGLLYFQLPKDSPPPAGCRVDGQRKLGHAHALVQTGTGEGVTISARRSR